MGNASHLYRFLNCSVHETDDQVTAKFMARLSDDAKSDANQAPRNRFIKAILAEHKKAQKFHRSLGF